MLCEQSEGTPSGRPWTRIGFLQFGAQKNHSILLEAKVIVVLLVAGVSVQACWDGVGHPLPKYPVARKPPEQQQQRPRSGFQRQPLWASVPITFWRSSLWLLPPSSQADAPPPSLWVSGDSGTFSPAPGALPAGACGHSALPWAFHPSPSLPPPSLCRGSVSGRVCQGQVDTSRQRHGPMSSGFILQETFP